MHPKSAWDEHQISKLKNFIPKGETFRDLSLISLINCIGKVFSSIISTRIKHYLDLTNRIGSEQAGFRKGHGCEDHTFALTKILSSYLANGKRVYATFLDYEKAFDLVDRAILWKKLQDHNINGNVFNVIRSLYSKTKVFSR